jgi:hypothetical protein
MLGRQLSGSGSKVEDVDRSVALGVNQRDVDIAFELGENRADAVQKSGLVLRDDFDQRAVRGTFIIKLNLRRSVSPGGLLFFHLQALAQTAATAISNIKFDKVIVWDSGNGANGAGAGGGAAGFLQSLAKSIPPMMNVMQDLGGVKMPEFLGKLTTEGSEAAATKGETVAAKVEAPKGGKTA